MKRSFGTPTIRQGMRRLSGELGLINDKWSDSDVSSPPSDELVCIVDIMRASGGSVR